MPKHTSSKVPQGAHVLRTYAEFFEIVDAFEHGELTLAMIVGPAGTGKSLAVEKHLKGHLAWILGGSRPYSFYLELYEDRDKPFVLDDADKIWRYQDGVSLLKQVTESTSPKLVQWKNLTPEIRSGDVPSEFTTSSRILILANSWPKLDPHIAAIQSRGELYYFCPSYQEMHRHAKKFVEDPEIYDEISKHIESLENFDLRFYAKVARQKATGLRRGRPEAWKQFVQDHCFHGDFRLVVDLLRDKSYKSDNKRAQEWHRITGDSERRFYRLKKTLLEKHPELKETKSGSTHDKASRKRTGL